MDSIIRIKISNLWLLQNNAEKNNHVYAQLACGQSSLWEKFLQVELQGSKHICILNFRLQNHFYHKSHQYVKNIPGYSQNLTLIITKKEIVKNGTKGKGRGVFALGPIIATTQIKPGLYSFLNTCCQAGGPTWETLVQLYSTKEKSK